MPSDCPSQLEEDFSAEQVAKLRKALDDGERCVEHAWQRRRTMREVTTRMKAHVISVVKSVITKESASDALYRQCFPNDLLVDEYKARRLRQKNDAERFAREAKAKAKGEGEAKGKGDAKAKSP